MLCGGVDHSETVTIRHFKNFVSTNNLFVSKSGESVEIYLGISGPKFFRDFFKFSHLEVTKQKPNRKLLKILELVLLVAMRILSPRFS